MQNPCLGHFAYFWKYIDAIFTFNACCGLVNVLRLDISWSPAVYYSMRLVFSSVADPDPVESGLFGSPEFGSGSGKIPDPNPDPLSTKHHCNLIFLFKYHCLKYSFVQIIVIFDFKCHKMIRFGKKIPLKQNYFAKHLKYIWGGSGSGRIRPFLGHPDPYLKNRIRGSESGSGKKWTGSATLVLRGLVARSVRIFPVWYIS